MWKLLITEIPLFFTKEQHQQILVIATGVVLGAAVVFLLYNLVRLLNWIGTWLHNLVYSFISIVWACIVLLCDLTLKIGRIATGLVLVCSLATGFWVYRNSPDLLLPLLSTWGDIALLLRIRQ